MEWLPNTVNAFANMLEKVGIIGSIAFVSVLTLLILLYKNFGAAIGLVRRFVNQRNLADVQIISKLYEIAETNQEISDRVNKLPSDLPICRAKSSDELEAMLKEKFASRGFDLTDAEIAIILKHREDVKKATIQSGAFPKINLEAPPGAQS